MGDLAIDAAVTGGNGSYKAELSPEWAAWGPNGGYIAANLDLTVQFRRPAADEQWLFAEGFADVAENGLIGFRSRVWSRSRQLLAYARGAPALTRSRKAAHSRGVKVRTPPPGFLLSRMAAPPLRAPATSTQLSPLPPL